MTSFSSAIKKVSGLRFIYESMNLNTSMGKKQLLMQPFLVKESDISAQIDEIAIVLELLTDTGNTPLIQDLKHTLSEVHDINGTLSLLESGIVLDDIGLFEVKKFALLISRLNALFINLQYTRVELVDTTVIIDILDPEKQRIPHFWIHDLYSEELARARKSYSSQVKVDPEAAEITRLNALAIEDSIRESLSASLKTHASDLIKSLVKIGQLDVWVAKATLALQLGLYKPSIASGTSSYSGLFNPQVVDTLALKGKHFQPVDIDIEVAPSLITGANMAGKTVLLKTIALAQYLFQFGFFVPASSALISPVEKILTSLTDEQSELKGLSSFAAEMLNINSIIEAAKSGQEILALIDEPARTTNPQEGKSLVNALVDILEKNNVRSLVTTHYSGLQTSCRRLRVRGLKTSELPGKPTIETINDYMDYSLVEVMSDEVPMEALKIASILKVDEELIEIATSYLEKKKINNN